MTRAAIGGRPYETVSSTTATAASTMATFWAAVGRSLRTVIPSTIVPSGAMK